MRDDHVTDLVFAALAHPARREILDLLLLSPGARVKDIASHFEFSRIATMKHLAVLEAADLVISEKSGRERLHHFNAVPIQRIYDRWTSVYSSFWAERMSDIQSRVEARVEARAKQRKKHA
jgi:DNA-binding transcriptional ArsR family regulator